MNLATAIRKSLWTTLGTLTVGAALVLSVPGVQVARADSDGGEFDRFATFVGEGGSARPAANSHCEGGRGVRGSDVDVSALMAKAAEKVAQRQARRGAKDTEQYPRVTMLNNRGYNYGATQGPQDGLGAIEQELRRHSKR